MIIFLKQKNLSNLTGHGKATAKASLEFRHIAEPDKFRLLKQSLFKNLDHFISDTSTGHGKATAKARLEF